MKLEEERAYLNQHIIWGLRQNDPALTQHIKSVDPHYDRFVWKDYRVWPKPPNSRFLSPHPATYLT